ncbi:MAG: hypothetical protein VR65_07055 [Desulfobulbaceae bacterium BRH_c16a]|nr:MAG: hypothetical protein VR65_07055 [Desulfobulbaceae bacterium BRH_c16a]
MVAGVERAFIFLLIRITPTFIQYPLPLIVGSEYCRKNEAFLWPSCRCTAVADSMMNTPMPCRGGRWQNPGPDSARNRLVDFPSSPLS